MTNVRNVCSSALVGLLACVSMARADEIKVGGTGSAHALLELLGQEFAAANPGNTVEAVPGLGSSGAISALKEGVLHVAVSGRELKPDEQAKLSSAPFLDTPYIFVTSHPKPQSVTSMDVVRVLSDELRAWPDGKDIRVILRPRSDAAVSFLLDALPDLKAGMDKLRRRPDVPVAATDQDNSDAAQRTPNSFAGMTLLQFKTEKPRLRSIALDSTEASVDAVRNGTYPLKMRLTLVWSPQPRPGAEKFLSFLRSPVAATIIRDSGAEIVEVRRPNT